MRTAVLRCFRGGGRIQTGFVRNTRGCGTRRWCTSTLLFSKIEYGFWVTVKGEGELVHSLPEDQYRIMLKTEFMKDRNLEAALDRVHQYMVSLAARYL